MYSKFRSLILLCLVFLQSEAIAQSPSTLVYGVGLEPGTDRLVSVVKPGSPAEEVGLKVGDKVLMVDTKSTEDMDNTAIVRQLGYNNATDITIERAGQTKKVHMVKVAYGAFGRTCISGNCVNGKGRMRMVNWNNREYEGSFKDGDLAGQGTIYAADGSLMYEGEMKYLMRWGKGKSYGVNTSGKSYLKEEGDYINVLSKGKQYGPDGTILSSGEYVADDKDEPRMFSGSLPVVYRGKNAVAEIHHIDKDRNKDGSLKYNGRVVVFEGSIGNTGKALSDANYENGKREGRSREWDRENGLIHIIKYKDGKPSEEWWEGAEIIRISDTATIAIGVKYAAGSTPENDMIYKIASGNFRFGSGYKFVTGPAGGSTIATFKNLYATAPERQASVSTGSTMATSGNGRYSSDVVSECDGVIQENIRRFREAASIYNNADLDKGYRASRINYTQLQQEIIADCDRAIGIYKDRVPSDRISMLREIRNTLNSHNLGSGLFMSMPIVIGE